MARDRDEASAARTVFRGGALRVASTGTSLLLGLPATAVLVRTMGIGHYGSLQLAISVVTLLAAFSGVGMGLGLSRLCAYEDHRAAEWARAGVTVAVGAAMLGTA